jgi:hypothetical protein
MSIPMIVAVRMLLTLGIVTSLVVCDSFMCRVGLGVGVVGFVAPLTIWRTTRRMLKIGQNEGRTRELADMLTEHVKLHGG